MSHMHSFDMNSPIYFRYMPLAWRVELVFYFLPLK